MNIGSIFSRSVDTTKSEKTSLYKKLTGGTIKGNGTVRQMKAAKKARNFHSTAATLGYTWGAMDVVRGPFHAIFPGGPVFIAGVWEHCNAIDANNTIKALKPDYKAIVKRAKSIYK